MDGSPVSLLEQNLAGFLFESELALWQGRPERARAVVMSAPEAAEARCFGESQKAPVHELGLSRREHEVLLLLAGGRTNAQIGNSLFISAKTASVHVSNILRKLGVSGRGEAAAVAHRLGLAGVPSPPPTRHQERRDGRPGQRTLHLLDVIRHHDGVDASTFVIARNPEEGSTLPYLLRLPIDGGLVLKARAAWPDTARVYCHEVAEGWPADAEVLERLEVRSCRRRGSAIDLLLARGRNNRSQFVFTRLKGGRPAVFWQTAKTARAARPGARMPKRRAAGQRDLVIVADSRERYAYRFADRQASVERGALEAGDYAITTGDGAVLAAVERKRFDNFVAGLVDGSLQFQLAHLAELPRAAVVVEGRYEQLFKLERTQPGWVVELLARLQVRHPAVPIVFAGSRKHAEEYTFRFLGAARAELDESGDA